MSAAVDTPAAKHLREPAKQQIGAGIAPHGEAAEMTGLLPVAFAAVFDLLQRAQIFGVVRLI